MVKYGQEVFHVLDINSGIVLMSFEIAISH